MSKMKLRTKIPINYYEPEEPSFDKYIYCDHCRDFVYEYCSLHGPLLVIPDDEVPLRAGFSFFVPRAALTIPSEFLHIAPSIIPGAGIGVFATLTLPSGVRFGPFCGQRTKHITSQYCWKIHDSNNRYNYAIDASDASASNWMRYVNCARHWHEQNLVAYQYYGQIYYRTIKIIPRFTELMVFYGSECAMALKIDMRSYNSTEFCQKIAYRKSNQDAVPTIYGGINNFIENVTKEKSITDMSFEEPFTDHHFMPTTIKDFVIIDTPEDSLDSKLQSDQDNFKNIESGDPFQRPSDDKNGLTCDICQKTLSRPYTLKRHYRMHDVNMNASKAKKQTTDTNKDCLSPKLLENKENYVKIKSNDRFSDIFSTNNTNGLTCNVCNKIFVTRYNLKRHSRMHDDNKNKPNTIIYTQEDSSSTKTLKDLETGRDSNNGRTCHICQKSFVDRYGLKRHLKIHTLNKNESNGIITNTEGVSFDIKTQENCKDAKSDEVYNVHDESKTKLLSSNEFSIPLSNKFDKTIKNTRKCNICNRSFAKNYMLRHKLIHSVKRYSCTQCPYKTNFMYILKDHVESHSDTTFYKCDMCSYSGSKRSDILRHLQRNHK